MDAVRQSCRACGSRELFNILVREPGSPRVVYVRCGGCEQLVARYELSTYYHHGQDIESFLRSRGGGSMESGRRVLAQFERAKNEAVDGFEQALELLAERDRQADEES